MAEITLKAETGRELGSGPSKRLRVDGKVPAVVYGLDAEPVPVTVDWRPLREVLTTDAGLNVLIDLDVDGDVALCMVKELQRHPIRGNVLHLDFLRVSRDAAIIVEVPIILEGEALKVARESGTLDHLMFALTVSAKPADIPNEIIINISEMEMGDHIRVSDLVLPNGVTTEVDVDDLVVTTVHGDTVTEEVEEDEAEGGEATGEAAAGSADGGAEG